MVELLDVDGGALFAGARAGAGDVGTVFDGLAVEGVLGALLDGPASLASRLSLI